MMARSAGFEPTASASAGLRSIQLSYERPLFMMATRRAPVSVELRMVPKVGFEPTRPCGHYALNVARLPFRHFGKNREMVGGTRLEPSSGGQVCDLSPEATAPPTEHNAQLLVGGTGLEPVTSSV